MEEFQDPISMGFHLDDNLNEENMKLYINAGADTYELASMFNTMSEKQGIQPNFKVTSANVSSEINRNDRLCIYIDDLNLLPKYIEILEKIKSERSDFNIQTPIPTVGNIDNWIGIGTDSMPDSSYNKDICEIIKNICNKHFENLNQTQINNLIATNPSLLDTIKKEMQELCVNQGKSSEKICIKSVDENKLKEMTFENDKVDSTILEHNNNTTPESNTVSPTNLEQFAKSLSIENFNNENMQFLYENGYNGNFDNPFFYTTYKLYCKEKEQENQIRKLKEKIKNQDDIIRYDSELINNLNNKVRSLCLFIESTYSSLINIGNNFTKVFQGTIELQKRLSENESKNAFSKLIDKIKNKFSKPIGLPESKQCENISLDNLTASNNLTQITAITNRQNEDNKNEFLNLNTTIQKRQEMVSNLDLPNDKIHESSAKENPYEQYSLDEK